MAFTYSVMLDLAGQTALVAGGGEVAGRKVRRLLESEAQVVVIAPSLCDELAALAQAGALHWEGRPFALADIAAWTPFIVIAATDDAALNGDIADYCRGQRILVNTITEPERGTLAVQAEIRRADYAVSVSTYGQGPGFSRALRAYLEEHLDARMDDAVRLYITLRAWVMENEPDPATRTALLRRLELTRLCEWLDEHAALDHDELLEKVKEWLFC